jgi:formate/nitrite transporter FocA (FNT family)
MRMAHEVGLDKEGAEPKKPYRQILIEEISEGKHELERQPLGLYLAALFAGQGAGWGSFGHFLLYTTLGNALGGTVFVALLKYSHAIRGESS